MTRDNDGTAGRSEGSDGERKGAKYRGVIPEVLKHTSRLGNHSTIKVNNTKYMYIYTSFMLIRSPHLCRHNQLKATVLTKRTPEWLNAWLYLLRVIFSQSMRRAERRGGDIFTYSALWLMYSPPSPSLLPKITPLPIIFSLQLKIKKNTTIRFTAVDSVFLTIVNLVGIVGKYFCGFEHSDENICGRLMTWHFITVNIKITIM